MLDSHLQVVTPFLGLAVNMLIQVFAFRTILRQRLLLSIALGFVSGFIAVMLIGVYSFSKTKTMMWDSLDIIFTNLTIYSLLGYCYFHFINLGETGRRIRILIELRDSKDGLSMKELLQRYNAKDVIEKRINRLINSGQIIYRDGRYYIHSPIMLLIAKIMVAMKSLIFIKKEEGLTNV